MSNGTPFAISFPRSCGRLVEADFAGGTISSNGGAFLLSQADKRMGLLSGLARRLEDKRQAGKVDHRLLPLLRQRVYGIALGHEDVNDHDDLRDDPVLQAACGRSERLASASTVGRLERAADRAWAWQAHEVLAERFIASFDRPPEELVLDFDATDDAVHGTQEGRFFHGYYDHYCFLPLYVFCGEQLLVGYLRPANIDGAKHAWAILALLVKRLRRAWPGVRLILRADSGFCRHKMLSWCERKGVGYIVGLARNARLERMAQPVMARAAAGFRASGSKQRRFAELRYGAISWRRQRRVIARLDHGAPKGAKGGGDARFLVTNLEGNGRRLYEALYCRRGEMENRIKEQQLDLFADRTSCHGWWPNQFRLILSSLAYCLVEAIRRLALQGSEMARAQVGTIRLRLLKIGALVSQNTRRVAIHLSSAYPDKALFALVARRLRPK